MPKISTPLQTQPMNPKNLIERMVLLHKPRSNPTTPKLINIIGCKKGQATFHVVENTMEKRQYSLTHKTMAKAIEKGRKVLIESLHQIHVDTMVSQENILDKQLDYFKEKIKNKNINKNQTNMVKNQANMVKVFTKLTQVMNMAFSWVANNNDNI